MYHGVLLMWCLVSMGHLWESLFLGIADSHAPIQQRRLKGHKTPWVNSNLVGRVVQKVISANPGLEFNRLFILVCSA